MSTAVSSPMVVEQVVVDPALASQALTLTERAHGLRVTTPEVRTEACQLGITVAALIKEAQEWFGPMKRAAKATHTAICDKETQVLAPLETAKRYLASQIGGFDLEEEKRRREEEDRRQEKARAEAMSAARQVNEEQALNDAIALEAAGDNKGAEAVLSNPVPVVPQAVYVPPVVVPRATVEVKGASTARTWKFKVTDAKLIPDEYWLLDEKAIAGVVRSLKEKTKIPGIEVYPEGNARFRA